MNFSASVLEATERHSKEVLVHTPLLVKSHVAGAVQSSVSCGRVTSMLS